MLPAARVPTASPDERYRSRRNGNQRTVRSGDGYILVRRVLDAGKLASDEPAAPSQYGSIAPPTARVRGSEAIVPVAERRLGNRLIVPAGERIPLDGRVIEGSSAINQAPTGESIPVEKQSGADVFSGTIKGDGTLTIETTKTAKDTTLARIIHTVEEAHARRVPSEQ
jgi:cation transport ATPase